MTHYNTLEEWLNDPNAHVLKGYGEYVRDLPERNDSILGDTWTDVKRGVYGIGEGAAGLADMGLAAIGYDGANGTVSQALRDSSVGKWGQDLEKEYSPARAQSDAEVRQAIDASGGGLSEFGETVWQYATHPRSLFGMAVQSAPAMVVSGGVGGLGARKAALHFGADAARAARIGTAGAHVGEGVVSAGQTANGVIQRNQELGNPAYQGMLGAGLTAGASTSLIGMGMGKYAPKLSGGRISANAETSFLGLTDPAVNGPAGSGFAAGLRARAGAAVGEGLEEALQAPGETIPANLATGDPWNRGLGENLASSTMAGGALGGALHRNGVRQNEQTNMLDTETDAKDRAKSNMAGQSPADSAAPSNEVQAPESPEPSEGGEPEAAEGEGTQSSQPERPQLSPRQEGILAETKANLRQTNPEYLADVEATYPDPVDQYNALVEGGFKEEKPAEAAQPAQEQTEQEPPAAPAAEPAEPDATIDPRSPNALDRYYEVIGGTDILGPNDNNNTAKTGINRYNAQCRLNPFTPTLVRVLCEAKRAVADNSAMATVWNKLEGPLRACKTTEDVVSVATAKRDTAKTITEQDFWSAVIDVATNPDGDSASFLALQAARVEARDGKKKQAAEEAKAKKDAEATARREAAQAERERLHNEAEARRAEKAAANPRRSQAAGGSKYNNDDVIDVEEEPTFRPVSEEDEAPVEATDEAVPAEEPVQAQPEEAVAEAPDAPEKPEPAEPAAPVEEAVPEAAEAPVAPEKAEPAEPVAPAEDVATEPAEAPATEPATEVAPAGKPAAQEAPKEGGPSTPRKPDMQKRLDNFVNRAVQDAWDDETVDARFAEHFTKLGMPEDVAAVVLPAVKQKIAEHREAAAKAKADEQAAKKAQRSERAKAARAAKGNAGKQAATVSKARTAAKKKQAETKHGSTDIDATATEMANAMEDVFSSRIKETPADGTATRETTLSAVAEVLHAMGGSATLKYKTLRILLAKKHSEFGAKGLFDHNDFVEGVGEYIASSNEFTDEQFQQLARDCAHARQPVNKAAEAPAAVAAAAAEPSPAPTVEKKEKKWKIDEEEKAKAEREAVAKAAEKPVEAPKEEPAPEPKAEPEAPAEGKKEAPEKAKKAVATSKARSKAKKAKAAEKPVEAPKEEPAPAPKAEPEAPAEGKKEAPAENSGAVATIRQELTTALKTGELAVKTIKAIPAAVAKGLEQPLVAVRGEAQKAMLPAMVKFSAEFKEKNGRLPNKEEMKTALLNAMADSGYVTKEMNVGKWLVGPDGKLLYDGKDSPLGKLLKHKTANEKILKEREDYRDLEAARKRVLSQAVMRVKVVVYHTVLRAERTPAEKKLSEEAVIALRLRRFVTNSCVSPEVLGTAVAELLEDRDLDQANWSYSRLRGLGMALITQFGSKAGVADATRQLETNEAIVQRLKAVAEAMPENKLPTAVRGRILDAMTNLLSTARREERDALLLEKPDAGSEDEKAVEAAKAAVKRYRTAEQVHQRLNRSSDSATPGNGLDADFVNKRTEAARIPLDLSKCEKEMQEAADNMRRLSSNATAKAYLAREGFDETRLGLTEKPVEGTVARAKAAAKRAVSLRQTLDSGRLTGEEKEAAQEELRAAQKEINQLTEDPVVREAAADFLKEELDAEEQGAETQELMRSDRQEDGASEADPTVAGANDLSVATSAGASANVGSGTAGIRLVRRVWELLTGKKYNSRTGFDSQMPPERNEEQVDEAVRLITETVGSLSEDSLSAAYTALYEIEDRLGLAGDLTLPLMDAVSAMSAEKVADAFGGTTYKQAAAAFNEEVATAKEKLANLREMEPGEEANMSDEDVLLAAEEADRDASDASDTKRIILYDDDVDNNSAGPYLSDEQYSIRSGARTGASRGEVALSLARAGLGKVLNGLRKSGIVSMVATQQDLPAHLRSGKAVQGVYDPRTGKIYLVAENIDPKNAKGVLLHEVGVHMAADGSPLMTKAMDQAVTWVNGNPRDPVARRVKERLRNAGLMDGNTVTRANREEAMAYLVEEASKSEPKTALGRWWQGVKSAIKAWFLKRTRFNPKLSEQDFVAIARGNAVRLSKGDGPKPRGPGKPMHSVASAKESVSQSAEHLQSLWKDIKEGALSSKLFLGSLFTSDLVALAKKHVPQVVAYDNVRRMQEDFRNTIVARGTDIKNLYSKLNEKQQGQVNSMLELATVHNIWPFAQENRFHDVDDRIDSKGNAVPGKTAEMAFSEYNDKMKERNPDGHKAVTEAWNRLSGQEREVVKRVLNWGVEMPQMQADLIGNTITEQYKQRIASAPTEAEKTKLIKERDADLRAKKAIIAKGAGPYVPLRRYGDHIVIVRSKAYRALEAEVEHKFKLAKQRWGATPLEHALKGYREALARLEQMGTNSEDYQVYTYETRGEAKKYAREFEKQYGTDDWSVETTEKLAWTGSRMPKWAALQQVDIAADEEAFINEFGNGDRELADRYRQLSATARDLWLTRLASDSARKAKLSRRTVMGYNKNMMQNFMAGVQANAMLSAELKYGPQINQALSEVFKAARKGPNREKAVPYVNEILRRREQDLTQHPSETVSKIMGASSVMLLLTNPGYHIQNATQPYMMSAPYMAGRFGMKAFAEMGAWHVKLLNAVRAWDIKNSVGMDEILKRAGVDADLRKGLEAARSKGIVDIGMSQDMGDFGNSTVKGVQVAQKVAYKLRDFARRQEIANRMSTYCVAYELARKAGDSVETAQAYAEKVIRETHGDYSSYNAPRYFKLNGFARVATQFRKFTLIQLGMFTRTAWDAFKHESPEVRAMARRELMYLAGTHLSFAGMVGSPLGTLVMATLAMGLGGPDGEDDEERLRRALGKGFLTDALLRGLPAAMGVDLSGKIGASGMLDPFPYADFKPEKGRDNLYQYAAALFGPAGGLAARAWDAAKWSHLGDYDKALEQVLPTGLANVMKAYRLSEKGMTTKSGDRVMKPEDFDTLDVLMQALGLPTTKITERTRVMGNLINYENHFKDARQVIRKQYAEARRNHDAKGVADARAAWRKLDKDAKELGFAPMGVARLYSGYAQQLKRERSSIGGVESKRTNQKYLKRWLE